MTISQAGDAGSALDVRRPVAEWLAWTETLFLTALCIVLPWWAHPNNPFFINEGFPWPALGPIIVALRYGFAHGFTSSLLLLAVIGAGVEKLWWPAKAFPFTYAVGIITVAMLCGEFRDIWQRRLNRLQGANDYRSERLEEFTRSFHLLRISHDQLEQSLASNGLSLREALTRLKMDIEQVSVFSNEHGERVLALLAEYGSLQAAAIYPVDANGDMNVAALAQLGEMPEVSSGDAMIKRCLREGLTIAVGMDAASIAQAQRSPLLACIPFIDCQGHIHAILAIHAMPFFALKQASLRVLAIMVAHCADQFAQHAGLDGERDFVREMARVLRDREKFDVPSTLILVNAADDLEHRRVLDGWRRQLRALDLWREKTIDGERRIALLLPMTNEAGARIWLTRLNKTETLRVRVQALDNQLAAQALLSDWE